MSGRTLVLGGARSGKSAHAEGLLPAEGAATYVATARRDPDDPEWTERIATHVRRRPASWQTVEAPNPADLPELLRGRTATDPPMLVDDVATWLTNALDDLKWASSPTDETDELVSAVRDCPARLVLVSAEVGLGVVPATRSGRLFRDELGSLNARLAEVCDEVLLLVAGIPMRLR
ncbi:MAG TPA: bifunctional adenosylcobinamide kinase/adenosylcobinamide-phosphate guanylyltransferase [Pseudonocardiaceae bacterium]